MPLVLLALLVGSVFFSARAADDPQSAETTASDTRIRVSIPYVTNRRPETDDADNIVYTGERGAPSFGMCTVTFRPIPIIDKIAPRVPFYVPDEIREVEIERQSHLNPFLNELTADIARSSSASVVVLVHGYNYGFERHCAVAAELQRSLKGRLRVLMFSWPSNGRPSDYIPDQADVEWSVPFLAQTLAHLGDLIGPEKVQVLAHSLGSRGIVFALERLGAAREQRPVIGPLVLMAPDFDAQTFVERLPELVPLTAGITLYASGNDTPLKVSRQLHQSPRLGEAGEFLSVAEGMQTLDVSPLGRYQVLGHEYFLFHPRVAADLAVLLAEGRSATDRPGLQPVTFNGMDYWELIGDASIPPPLK